MQSLRGRESDELRGRICKIFLAFTLSCNFVSNNKGQKGRDYNPVMHIRLIRVDVIMAWTFFSQFQNAGRQGATQESISRGVLLTEY